MKKLTKKNILYILIAFLAPPLTASAIRLPDPLGADDPLEIFARIIKAFLGFVGIIALISFVIAGIGLIISQGKAEKIEEHKKNLLWTVVGIFLIFASYAILSFVLDRLSGASIG